MVIFLKAGTQLREHLKPDVDYYTRKVEAPEGMTLKQILESIGVNPGFVAFAYTEGKIKNLEYIPAEGEKITLQPPVSGG
jgi:sulfur carrier protein ThiS